MKIRMGDIRNISERSNSNRNIFVLVDTMPIADEENADGFWDGFEFQTIITGDCLELISRKCSDGLFFNIYTKRQGKHSLDKNRVLYVDLSIDHGSMVYGRIMTNKEFEEHQQYVRSRKIRVALYS